MKYLLIIGDGMADNPLRALGGQTPLERAHKPVIDALAARGVLGSVLTVPSDYPPGSDTAIMSIFGCAPAKYYAGRAPLEAAAQGICLNPGDAAFRCNNICLSDEPEFENKHIVSHSAGGVDGETSMELVSWLFRQPEFQALAEKAGMELHPTLSYRHIAVQRAADIRGLRLAPPHDHLGELAGANLPTGCADAAILTELMKKANTLLDAHPINQARRAEGKLPANAIWFWAEGTAARLPNFYAQYGKTGAVISAVPLCHGIAELVGLDVVLVPGATGELDTNFEGKVRAALDAVETHDFVAVHLEAPDECTHNNDLEGKVTAIEWLDSKITAPILTAMERRGEPFRILMLSDHKTLMEGGMHDGDPVPFLVYDSRTDTGAGLPYTEKNGLLGPYLGEGTLLMPALFEQYPL
jgi:2,3-bisphosphoglycerate-independent phosphoglycerate mutase